LISFPPSTSTAMLDPRGIRSVITKRSWVDRQLSRVVIPATKAKSGIWRMAMSKLANWLVSLF
jgi:hypothetical protein